MRARPAQEIPESAILLMADAGSTAAKEMLSEADEIKARGNAYRFMLQSDGGRIYVQEGLIFKDEEAVIVARALLKSHGRLP